MVLKKIQKSAKNSRHVTIRKTRKPRADVMNVRGYYSILIIILLVFLDRITKLWIMSIERVIDYGWIAFHYVTNTGAGFSILENMNALLAIVSVIVLAALIYYRNQVNKFSLILIISGIIGNLIDRVSLGYVIDFVDLKFWPIFNIADSLIFIGVVYWIIVLWKK